jgi:ATP-dependent DNA helicase RecQ
MGGGRSCIGAISESGKNLRLLSQHCGYQASPFQIGQVWDVTIDECDIKPPHIEDVAVLGQALVGVEADLSAFILAHVRPWKGGIQDLFEGFIRFTGTGSGYVAEHSGLPATATGFWLPNSELILERVPRGELYGPPKDYRHLKYVGFERTIPNIPADTLVRVSLAKWWKPQDADASFEERCYAQLSGWY